MQYIRTASGYIFVEGDEEADLEREERHELLANGIDPIKGLSNLKGVEDD
jgi:hypothetical protein